MALDPEPIPVLTLWQPWASLIALGVKRIETRPWATNYRGPLAIHSALRRPRQMHLPRLWSRGSTRDEQDRWNRETWFVCETITDPAHQRPHRTNPPERIPKASQTPTLFFPHSGPHADVNPETGYARTLHLPLGAIVAVCDLIDVVATADLGWTELWPRWAWQRNGSPVYPPQVRRSVEGLSVIAPTSEQPFGDFTPGRFGWLLDNIRPLDEPVPFKGGQRLTRRWTPEATMSR